MNTYTKTDIQNMVKPLVLRSAEQHKINDANAVLTVICNNILNERLTKDSYTNDEQLAIVNVLDTHMHDYLQHRGTKSWINYKH